MSTKTASPKVSTQKLRATPENEDFAHKYTEDGAGGIGGMLIEGYFRTVNKLLNEAKLPKKGKLRAIELGCGEGFSTSRLKAMMPAGMTLEASEYVTDLVPKARKLNPGMTVTQESVYELKHADNTFDVIFFLEVLEHLDYPKQALAEIARVLKPDGVLILGVPREPLWSMLNLARGKYVRHFGNTIGHLNHWSTFTLQRYMAKHFGTVEKTATPLPWTLVRARKR